MLDLIWYCAMMEFAGRGVFNLCAGEFFRGVLCVMNFIAMLMVTYKWAKRDKQKRLEEKRKSMLKKHINLVEAAKKATGRGRKNEVFN